MKVKHWFGLFSITLILFAAVILSMESPSDTTTKPPGEIDSGFHSVLADSPDKSPPNAGMSDDAGSIKRTTAAISGVIRHNGSPTSGITVNITWNSGVESTTTGADGVYNFSSIPDGSWVFLDIRPPVTQRLAFITWRTETVTGNVVKDFDLESGYLLTGEYHNPDGSRYTGFPPEIIPIDTLFPAGEKPGQAMEPDGTINVVLRPGYYAVIDSFEMSSNFKFIPSSIIDLNHGDALGKAITILDHYPQVPTTPPIADLISVSPPDLEGYATVAGAAGSVPPDVAIAVISLNTHTLKVTASDGTGAFSTNLYAPPGSSILIKYDPRGDQVSSLWARSFVENLPGDATLNSLPGTILRVGTIPVGGAAAQTFNSVGAWIREPPGVVPTLMETNETRLTNAAAITPAGGWAGWWISGTLVIPGGGGGGSGFTVQPGQTITLTARVQVTSPGLNCTDPLTYSLSFQSQLLSQFGTDGSAESWGVWFTPYLFTPTGLPIEREVFGERIPFGPPADFSPATCISANTFEAFLNLTMQLPTSLPDGIYLPIADEVNSGGVPLAPMPIVPVWYHSIAVSMPPLTVGSPEPPHIPWTLLGDYPFNGHRGIVAREDVNTFAMPNRVIHPPFQVVVPRLDPRTGEPLTYQLEPGSNWIASTDRRQPNPPIIPFDFPSGNLTVGVLKPDGTTDTLGPATIQQSSLRTPTLPGGGLIDFGSGYIADIYRLITLDSAFAYSFDQYGHHVITLSGKVDDIYGNTYDINGTYDLYVARILDLDPAELPTTPYMQGDFFAPGLHIFPPVPADVTVQLVQIPFSDPGQTITTTITGQANRFGYFQPPVGTAIEMTAPGEFRVDISAVYTDTEGTLWRGAVTWGNVIQAPGAIIEAHGRRGMDLQPNSTPWFEVANLPPEAVGLHINFPYFSGDIHWGTGEPVGESIMPIITLKDVTPQGTIYNIMRANASSPYAYIEGNLETMIGNGEAPLFTTSSGVRDPGFAPDDIDQWAYWYGSSEKADVHVRETIAIGNEPTGYWRFDDTYGYQIGVASDGDHPGDMKWEFGGAVFRTLTDTNPINEYAIYSSLWVLLPDNDPVGARVTPPFQDATGASINGGPIMTLLGQDIDMLFLPKGVRPGDVLEVGDTISFSGHVGPPLDSRVAVTITAPSGAQHIGVWHANKIGWLYDPGFDFTANEPGRWTVTVSVLHDRPYIGNGVTPTSHNTGTVLGTSGQYEFYVVEPGAPRLFVYAPSPGFLIWPNQQVAPIAIRGVAPPGTTTVYYTVHDKGIVMSQGSLIPDTGGGFTFTYDAKALHNDFSMLSLTAHEGRWEGLADEVEINFLALGAEPRANTVTLIGEEVFVGGGGAERIFLPLLVK